jgi:hypothetical protein
VTISSFGVVTAIAGLEHGIGEMLQGDKRPDAVVFQSWPDSPAFSILGGEPAMTIVPNLLVTGILAITASVAFLVWVMLFIQRKNGGLVLVALSLVLLLVGGGFGPPVLGFILGSAAQKMTPPPSREPTASQVRRLLAKLWPWSLGSGVTAWLALLPGSVIVAYVFRLDDTSTAFAIAVSVLIAAAFGLLLLAIVSSFAYDAERAVVSHRSSAWQP